MPKRRQKKQRRKRSRKKKESNAQKNRRNAGAGENAASAILEGLDQLAGQCTHLIVVSNEVFSGGADYADDTGRYLKALAQVNKALAARADHVVRVVCGIPVYYKGVEK